MKIRLWAILIVSCVLLCGCVSEEDKNAAQSVIDQINGIDSVTLESAKFIYEIQNEYNALSDKQKNMVKNYSKFKDITTQLEQLVIEDEIKNDPTNTITESDLIGIWQEDGADTHVGYLYFTQQGYVYYLVSKETATQSDFTDEYLISTKYLLGDYNNATRVKEGEFYCVPSKINYGFSVTKSVDGEMTLDVTGEILEGIYHKSGEKIDLTPKQCRHNGCSKKAVTSGDSRYCEEHSNECMGCGEYIDEDAMFCLNCIVDALKEYD